MSTLTASYLSSSAQSAGAAADLAASRKEAKYPKYPSLMNSYIFQLIAIESHGAFRTRALFFITLRERLAGTSGDLREMSYLFQKLGHYTAFHFGFNRRKFCFFRRRTDV